jgi:hypothetical protein
MLTKCKLVDEKLKINQVDAVAIIEQYFTKGTRLQDKLTDEVFAKFYKENPLLIAVNREIDARKKKNAAIKKRREEHELHLKHLDAEAAAKVPAFTEQEEPEMDEETRRSKEEAQLAELKKNWYSDTVSKHLVYCKGVEVCFFEFKEILLAFAVKLREQIDPKTGKLKVVLTKFIEEWVLPRLQSFVKFKIPTSKHKQDAARSWPESEKDLEMKALLAEKTKKSHEEAKRKAERDHQMQELARMQEEDMDAPSPRQLEERRKKQLEEEERERRQKEAAEEDASAVDESSEEEESENSSEEDEDQ